MVESGGLLRQVVFYRTSEGKEGKEIGERKLLSIRELNKGRNEKKKPSSFNEGQNRMRKLPALRRRTP